MYNLNVEVIVHVIVIDSQVIVLIIVIYILNVEVIIDSQVIVIVIVIYNLNVEVIVIVIDLK